MKGINNFILVGVLCFFSIQCNEFEHRPLMKGSKPEPLNVDSYITREGKVTIYFSILDTLNTQHIIAEYFTSDDSKSKKNQVLASIHTDSIILNGFAHSGVFNISLYSVGFDGQRSDPMSLDVEVKSPAYLDVLDHINISEIFGGVQIEGINKVGDDLSIMVISSDSILDRHFTNSKDFNYLILGLKNEEYKLGVYTRDNWMHTSDTIWFTATPLLEERMFFDFYPFKLPGDQYGGNASWSLDRLFDGFTEDPDASGHQAYFGNIPSEFPQWFSVDLGRKVVLSRVKVFPRLGKGGGVYSGPNPKDIRLWGSNDPNPNGDLDDTWTLLGEFTPVKPSGLPLGEFTQEDIDQSMAGWNLRFDEPTIPIQYFRFETLTTWSTSTYNTFTELEFYGLEY